MQYDLYADGACQPNPGTGGWAYIIDYGDNEFQHFDFGRQENTTNNQMELISILNGLEWIHGFFNSTGIDHTRFHPTSISITSDSKYALGGLSDWMYKWVTQNWCKKNGKPILNRDLWVFLYEVIHSLKEHNVAITYKHIPGHSGHKRNEECDMMAVKAIRNFKKHG